MKKNMLAVAVASALLVPFSANAAKVAGDALEIYGKIHVSIDAPDRDITGPDNTQDFSVSSNSSRLGFKGKHKMGNTGLTALYKLEQEVSIGSGAANTFTTRNTYVGVKGGFGQVIAGKHDTPYKTIGSKWGVFGDTIGDRRSILGARSSGGNLMNQRGENALMWSNKFGDLKAMVMYSADASDDDTGVVDTKSDTLTSVGALYNSKNTPFYFGAAYEDWDQLGGSATDGYRIMLGYQAGFGKVGFIYEDISSDNPALDRAVYGLNGIYKVGGGMDLRGQVLIADDSTAGPDTAATMFTLGLYKKFDKQTSMYAAYTQTDNDANAQYQGVDGGHGDEVRTDPGGTPNAFSVGVIYKF
jgi:hypothetical protein